MIKKTARIILSYFLVQSLIFTPFAFADEQLSLPSTDVTAPNVDLKPISHKVKIGSSQEITAIVTDDSGVKSVTLFFRAVGKKNYNRKPMLPIVGTDKYSTVVDRIPAKGLEYYIQAEDTQGNSVLHGYSFSPLIIQTEQSVPEGAGQTVAQEGGKGKQSTASKYKWLWIGLGVLAVGALAGGGGGSSGSSTATVTVGAPVP